MKWRLCAAVAALSLLLSGCSSLLARSYTSVTPHSATPLPRGTPPSFGWRTTRSWSMP